jgi:Ca-activated chloride channel homolog
MRRAAFGVGLWVLALAATAMAQRPLMFHAPKSYLPTAAEAPFVVRSRVAEVAMELAVTDRSGKPVARLGRDDLQILYNGEPAAITQISREDDLPLRIALVVDWSDSMRKEVGFECKVALDFLRTALRPDTDQTMVVGFRYRVEVTQPLTPDLQRIEAGLRPVAGASLSSVYDALLAATDALRNAGPSLRQRRAIVLLSDGEDNVSAHGWADVIQAAQRANIAIYSIAPRHRRAPVAGDQVLLKLTAATGGRAFFISPSGEQPAFDEIQQNLRLRYAVYIKPAAVDGDTLRSLEITPKDRNLQVWAWHSVHPEW